MKRAVRLGSGFISLARDIATFQQQRHDVMRLAELDRRDPAEITPTLVVHLDTRVSSAPAEGLRLGNSTPALVEGIRLLEASGVGHLLVAADAANDGLAAAELLAAARPMAASGRQGSTS